MEPRLAFLYSNASTQAILIRGRRWIFLVSSCLIFKFWVLQKVMVIEKSAGTNYPIPAYSLQHVSTHSISRSQETGMLPSSNQPNRATAVTASPPAVLSHISPIMINPQPLGVPVLSPASVLPTTGSIIGSTDLR